MIKLLNMEYKFKFDSMITQHADCHLTIIAKKFIFIGKVYNCTFKSLIKMLLVLKSVLICMSNRVKW
jgi:hypothetical protein